jgi:hypothetical protein
MRLADVNDKADDGFLVMVTLPVRMGLIIRLSFNCGLISGISCSVNTFCGSGIGLAAFIVSSDEVLLSFEENDEAVSPKPESTAISC